MPRGVQQGLSSQGLGQGLLAGHSVWRGCGAGLTSLTPAPNPTVLPAAEEALLPNRQDVPHPDQGVHPAAPRHRHPCHARL